MLCVCNILVDINVDNIHCTIKKRNFRERKKFKNLLVNEVAAVAADKIKINALLSSSGMQIIQKDILLVIIYMKIASEIEIMKHIVSLNSHRFLKIFVALKLTQD